jgi:Zn-dependent protease
MSTLVTSTDEVPAGDPPPREELERFQAVLQALRPKQPRFSPRTGPISTEREQTALVETDGGHTNGALAERHPVLPVILPAKPEASPEQSPVPRSQRTTGDSQRRTICWILFASSLGAALLVYVASAGNSEDVRARLIVAGLAMLASGLAYLVWGRPRGARPSVPMPLDPGNLPSLNWPPSTSVFPLRDLQEPPAERPPTSTTRRMMIAALTLLPWILFAIWRWPDLTVTWIVLTIAVHELGHWWALRLVGASDCRIYFIPFLGGLATGEKHNSTIGERLFVFLMGPAPGLVLGCLIYALDSWMPVPFGREPAFQLVLINLGNLLPIWPLDGGRIAREFLARQSALAQAILSVLSLVGTALVLSQTVGECVICAALWGLLVHGQTTYQEATSALNFQRCYPEALPHWHELSERQLWNLYVVVNEEAKKRPKVDVTAYLMRRTFDRASQIPRSPAPVWSWVAVVALYLLSAATVFETKLGSDWWEFRAKVRRQLEVQTSTPETPQTP